MIGYFLFIMTTMVIGTVRSKSNPNLRYNIIQDKAGEIYCSCPAWKFSKMYPKTCKHKDLFPFNIDLDDLAVRQAGEL